MGNFSNEFRKQENGVTPSGVSYVVKSLTGKHQRLITYEDSKKRQEGFYELMIDCFPEIGGKRTERKDIEKLINVDRNSMLVHLRQMSRNYNPRFQFWYEFATRGGIRLREHFDIGFDESDFPTRVPLWMKEKLIENYKEANAINPERELDEYELKQALEQERPVIFENYQDMLDAHLQQTFELPECGVEVSWQLVTVGHQVKFGVNVNRSNLTSHTQLELRNPTYKPDGAESGGTRKLPLDDLTLEDIEALRERTMDVEGDVNTRLVINSTKKEELSAEIDLVETAAFFFPSLGR